MTDCDMPPRQIYIGDDQYVEVGPSGMACVVDHSTLDINAVTLDREAIQALVYELSQYEFVDGGDL